MADSEQDIQSALRQQQTQARQSEDWRRFEADVETPRWIDKLTGVSELKTIQAKTLVSDLVTLWQQLPAIQALNSRSAKMAYLQKVVKQLTRIYYVRMRVVELDSAATMSNKSMRLNTLTEELQASIQAVAEALGDYNEI